MAAKIRTLQSGVPPYMQAYPVAAATVIEAGDYVGVLNTTGALVVQDDLAATLFVGIAEEGADNSGGALGDLHCQVRTNAVEEVGALTNADPEDVGDAVYCTAANTLAMTGTTPAAGVLAFAHEVAAGGLARIGVHLRGHGSRG